MDQKEIWRQVVNENYEPIGRYEVSNLGLVKNNGKILTQQTKVGSEYKRAHLYVPGRGAVYFSVHRLVALAFPEICGHWFPGATVDHLNGVKDDNRPENLLFKTITDNRKNPSTIENLRRASLENASKSHSPMAEFRRSLTRFRPVCADGLTQCFMNAYVLADYLGVTPAMVHHCLNGRAKTVKGFAVRYAD